MNLLDSNGLKAKGIPHGETQRNRLIKAKKFPRPIKIGKRNLWVEDEIDEYLASLMADRDAEAA